MLLKELVSNEQVHDDAELEDGDDSEEEERDEK